MPQYIAYPLRRKSKCEDRTMSIISDINKTEIAMSSVPEFLEHVVYLVWEVYQT